MEKHIWSPQMELGIPAMDNAHKAFFEELARVAATPPDQFGTVFFRLIAELERDFEEEEQLMEQISFPALNSHREQHARVLAGLHHVVPHVMDGDVDVGLQALEFLQEWFLFHLSTMDLALAVAIDLNNMEGQLLPSPLVQADFNRLLDQIRR
jgi:hemerythrin